MFDQKRENKLLHRELTERKIRILIHKSVSIRAIRVIRVLFCFDESNFFNPFQVVPILVPSSELKNII
jgi:hypothetical protein